MSASIEAFKKLETLTSKNRISFYRLGKELGFSNSFFSEWKKGKMMPKVEKLKIIAEYFGVPIEYFIGD